MGRFIIKKAQSFKPSIKYSKPDMNDKLKTDTNTQTVKQPIKEEEVMTTSEKVALANEVLGTKPRTRKLKADKGLIEKEETSMTILTEDNKELMFD